MSKKNKKRFCGEQRVQLAQCSHPRLFRMRQRLTRKAQQILERVLMHVALDAKELGWDTGRRLAAIAVSEALDGFSAEQQRARKET